MNKCLKQLIVLSLSLANQIYSADLVRRDSDEDRSQFSLATSCAAQGGSALFDDLQEIQIFDVPALTPEDLMPLISKNRNISKKERRAQLERILSRAQTRGSQNAYLADLQRLVAVRKTRSIGMPIQIQDEHIRPALEWLGKKVLKEDVELLSRKFDRQKVISGVSAIGAFVISSGLACLLSYIGTLY